VAVKIFQSCDKVVLPGLNFTSFGFGISFTFLSACNSCANDRIEATIRIIKILIVIILPPLKEYKRTCVLFVNDPYGDRKVKSGRELEHARNHGWDDVWSTVT
jgi:hypothetical protein